MNPPRLLAAVGLVLAGALLVASVAARQPPAVSLLRHGRTEVRLEVNRSP